MKVRELLRYEIWSKDTTQGILLAFGIIACSLIATSMAWYEFETHWLSKGERDAARLVLQRVNELQNVVALDQEYKVGEDRANAALKAAKEAAKTKKDESIQMNLLVCVTGVEILHGEILEQRLNLDGRPAPMRERIEAVERSGLSLIEAGKRSCSALHKELD
jgi:hypothetical protein